MDFRRLLPEIRWQSRLSPVPRSFPFAVNGSLGIVVAPVEPVVLEHGNRLQAQPFRLPRSRAALEVPLASSRVVYQQNARSSSDPVEVGGSAHPGDSVPERPHGLIVGPHHQQHRLGTHVILDQLFLNHPFIEKRPAGAERLDSQHQIASRQPVLPKTQYGGLTLHLYIPVSLGIVGHILRDIVRSERRRVWGCGVQTCALPISSEREPSTRAPENSVRWAHASSLHPSLSRHSRTYTSGHRPVRCPAVVPISRWRASAHRSEPTSTGGP